MIRVRMVADAYREDETLIHGRVLGAEVWAP